MKISNLLLTSLVLASASTTVLANQVKIDGSSTVFPISEGFAEDFQKKTKKQVVVGMSGTGGGFKKFCRGETDISGASRPIKKEEIELCKQNGVEYVELPVALDALAVIVNPANKWAECMTTAQLKKMWEPAAQGVVKNWNQVDAKYPNQPLKLFGAGVDSGTYDYFTLAINGKEHSSRGDFTATEDDNITIKGTQADKGALGFLGLAYATENARTVKTVKIRQANGQCVAPSVATAANASYQPLSRPLFYYVSKKSLQTNPTVKEFAYFIMDPKEVTSIVKEVGYVPLPAKAFSLGRKKVETLKTGTFFGGESKIGVKIEDLLK